MRTMSATVKRKKPGCFANKDKTHGRYEVQRLASNKWYKARTYADAAEASRYVECELVDSAECKPRLRVIDSNDGRVVFER